MQWYYEKAGEQIGPVSEEEFDSMVKSGAILSSTLVWNSTMTDWTEYGRLNAASGTGNADAAVCAECGGSFPKDDMIKYGQSYVCGRCKPVFIQKIKEGVTTTRDMNYAGFWIRVGAYLIDTIILGVVNFVFGIVLGIIGLSAMGGDDPSQGMLIQGMLTLINMAIYVFYETFFVGKWGATIGKMACGLKIVTPEGEPISYLRSFGRYFAKIVSSFVLCIGYIMVGFDDEKRALHDRMCSTRVIRK